jgi:hypothetical protein
MGFEYVSAQNEKSAVRLSRKWNPGRYNSAKNRPCNYPGALLIDAELLFFREIIGSDPL